MPNLTLRRRKSKQQMAMEAAGKAASAAVTFMKARIAWLAGKKAAKVAAPAVAVGTAAVVAKRRSDHQHEPPQRVDQQQPAAPAGVA